MRDDFDIMFSDGVRITEVERKKWLTENSHNTDPAREFTGGEWNPHPLHEGSDERAIFGKASDAKRFEYSDRLREWDRRKADVCWQRSRQKDQKMPNANRISRYLSLYFGKPIVCKFVSSGCNRATGYAYHVYGYVYTDEVKQ